MPSARWDYKGLMAGNVQEVKREKGVFVYTLPKKSNDWIKLRPIQLIKKEKKTELGKYEKQVKNKQTLFDNINIFAFL